MRLSAVVLIAALVCSRAHVAAEELCGPDAHNDFYRASEQAARFRSQGQFDKAVEALDQALFISRNNSFSHHHRQCLLRMAILKWDLGSISDCTSRFTEGMAAYKQAGDIRSAEFCKSCLTLIHLYEEGKKSREERLYHDSCNSLEQACSIGKMVGILDFELKCLRQKGLTLWEMGQIELSLECNKLALEISTKISHQVEKGRCLNNIGISYHKLNEYSLAVENLESALSITQEVGDRLTEAECRSNLGIVYRDLGDYTRARFYLSGALSLDREVGDSQSITSDLANLCTIDLRSGVDNKNKEELSQSLKTLLECASLQANAQQDGSIEHVLLNNIGVIYNELGDLGNSKRFLSQALQACEIGHYIQDEGCVLNNLATSHLYDNDLTEAAQFYQEALDLGLNSSLDDVVSGAAYGLGKCCEITGRSAEAVDYYERSITSIEGMRKRLASELMMIGFFRNKMSPYQSLISMLAMFFQEQPSIGSLERIFEFMERAKARAFLNSIENLGMGGMDPKALLIKERLIRLEDNIAELMERLRKSEFDDKDRSRWISELEREEEEYYDLASRFRADPQRNWNESLDEVCRLQQVQNLQKENASALLEYFIGEEKSFLVLITPETAELFLLAGRAELESSLRGFLKLISERSIDSRAGYAASERIAGELAPFNWQEKLGNVRSLVIIPDGVLNYLPFETLMIPEAGGSKYLIEKYSVSYCPSASSFVTLLCIPEDRKWKKEMLAVGGPIYNGDIPFVRETGSTQMIPGGAFLRKRRTDLTAIPQSRAEVSSLSRLFPKGKLEVLTGRAANEDTFKALPLEDFRIIHFACHGLLDEGHPLRSALVLSHDDEDKNDGLLQMREIYSLRIQADLVVLSACQTACGALEQKEGPMGITRAFFFSGAKAVLSTLWPVSDKAAAYLMEEFYRNYLRGQSFDKALRLAKLKMLDSAWAHPYYWAALTLHGRSNTHPVSRKSN
jgi:CHAT domain-containing protein